MGAEDKRDVTVLVLGRPGETARRYRINRRVVGLLVLALLVAGLALGYVLGSRSVTRSGVTKVAESAPSAAVHVVTRVMAARQAETVVPATPPTAVPAAAADAAPTVAAAAPAAEAAPAGEPLRILRDGQNQQLEVYPFAADGSPRASAFDQLETELACGSGHSQKPDAALVRVLLDAQHEFGKPIVLLGGRCAEHDDRPDTTAQHRAGRAVDVRVRGVSSEQLMSWLVKRGVGGAGRYKRAGFVHIDVRVGPREQWEGEEPAPERVAPKREPQPAAAAEAATEAAGPAPAAEPPAAEPKPAAQEPLEN